MTVDQIIKAQVVALSLFRSTLQRRTVPLALYELFLSMPKQGGITIKELARSSAISLATIKDHIDYLQGRFHRYYRSAGPALIASYENPRDRRSILLALTPMGSQLRIKIEQLLVGAEQKRESEVSLEVNIGASRGNKDLQAVQTS